MDADYLDTLGDEIGRDDALTRREKASVGLFALWSLLAILGILAIGALCGCANRGVKVVASTASATNLGDINWEEYKIPVFSIISGPRTTVWINKDYIALRKVRAGGSTTNETSTLGIYHDKGGRTNFVELEFGCVSTNEVLSAHGAVD